MAIAVFDSTTEPMPNICRCGHRETLHWHYEGRTSCDLSDCLCSDFLLAHALVDKATKRKENMNELTPSEIAQARRKARSGQIVQTDDAIIIARAQLAKDKEWESKQFNPDWKPDVQEIIREHDQAMEQAQQEGRREVVKFAEKNFLLRRDPGWQAKKKKWGIKWMKYTSQRKEEIVDRKDFLELPIEERRSLLHSEIEEAAEEAWEEGQTALREIGKGNHDQVYAQARREGRREVVEFIREKKRVMRTEIGAEGKLVSFFCPWLPWEEWQSKLKEWGIE